MPSKTRSHKGDETRFYMLVNGGLVQRWSQTDPDGTPLKLWPITESLDDAKRLIEWFKAPHLRPANIGSIQGESLESHIRLAIEEDCRGVACVAGWLEDGSPRWKFKFFD